MVKAGVILFVTLVATFGVVQLHVWNDCKYNGGVLVRDAYDMPATCVEMRTK